MSVVKDFSGKVILITGSSSGIGAGIAEEFSKAGAQVVITGRNANNLSEVGKQCLKVSPKGLKPLQVVADVSKEEDCKRLIDTTIEKFGKLDVLVNNAGKGHITPIEDTKILEKFDDLMNANLRSVVNLTQLSVKHLEKTKGNIINISSVAGITPVCLLCTSYLY
jgi:NAD(P)-dependent dehydrogenase (short-subunit alcohol dehydrogenase family)